MTSLRYDSGMNLDHLRVLVAVLECGTFTAAAARLRLSQPAVSQHMAALEKDVGIPLFERAGRLRVPTDAAHELGDRGRAALAALDDADRTAEELRGLQRGRLVVGASPTPGAYFVPALLGRFTDQHPDVALRIDIAEPDDLERRLRTRQTDLAIVGEFDPGEGILTTTLASDNLVPVWAPTSPLASIRRVSLERFLQEPFIAREAGSSTRAVLERWLGERGEVLRPAMELAEVDAIKQAVAAGLGVTVASESTVRLELEKGVLRVGKVPGFPLKRRIDVALLDGRRPSKAAEAFLSMLLGPKARKFLATARG
jgi:LysR family transcriptional regulator, low CO2-responsive transcriptional regulator